MTGQNLRIHLATLRGVGIEWLDFTIHQISGCRNKNARDGQEIWNTWIKNEIKNSVNLKTDHLGDLDIDGVIILN